MKKMDNSLLYLGLALFAGAIIPVQTSMNTVLGKQLQSPFYASLSVFLIAALAMTLVIMFRQQSVPSLAMASAAPWWSWLGGVVGASYIFLLVFLAPKLGIANVTGFVVAGQIFAALLIDHFGLLNFPVHPLNFQRLAGALLMMAGLFLIKRY
jgi:bacterial/archaeal transporter family-2 protein